MEPEIQAMRSAISTLLKKFDYLKRELHPPALKHLKSVVQKMPAIIPPFLDALFSFLHKEDSDMKLGILLLTDYFFLRSHAFRQELINFLEDFLVFTLETDPLHYPLPKPLAAAGQLKKEALKTVRAWIDKFGTGYSKLENARRFLQTSKHFDFESSSAEIQVHREQAEQEEFNRELRQRKLREKVESEFNESIDEIRRILIESMNVLELIVPKFSLENLTEKEKSISKNEKSTSQQNLLHGLSGENGSMAFTGVTVDLSSLTRIEETSDNKDIIQTLQDSKKALAVNLSKVNKWLKMLSKIGDSTPLTRQLIDLRRDLAEELAKCSDLSTIKQSSVKMPNGEEGDSSDDDDEDFIDYEKEGFEPNFSSIPSTLATFAPKSTQNSAFIDDFDEEFSDALPLIQQNNNKIMEMNTTTKIPKNSQTNSKERRGNGKEKAPPTLHMDLDLCYWEDSGIDRPSTSHHSFRNDLATESFWRTPDPDAMEAAQSSAADSYRCRMFTFVTDLPPIERQCRAPLPSGRLCPRMDRENCPLHGRIVDRDEQGHPASSVSLPTMKTTLQKEAAERALREEIELDRDIEAVTGVPGLTQNPSDAMKSTKTKSECSKPSKKMTTARKREASEAQKSRNRLQTKLLDRRTVKRLSKTLSDIQRARAERNFAHQFNYAVQRR